MNPKVSQINRKKERGGNDMGERWSEREGEKEKEKEEGGRGETDSLRNRMGEECRDVS